MGEDTDAHNASRGSGMFTQRDRELLMGDFDPAEYEDPADALRQARYRIRNRLKNGLLDFTLLVEGVAAEEIDLALGDAFDSGDPDSWGESPHLQAMRDAMYVFAYAVGSPRIVEEMVMSGVRQGFTDRQFTDEVWFDLLIYPFLYRSHSQTVKLAHLEALRERDLLREYCAEIYDARPPTPHLDAERTRDEAIDAMVDQIESRIDYTSGDG